MAHVDHCNTTPSYYDSSHTNSCYNFNNYADAHTNGCGHNNANPTLCPGAFQGDFHVNNSCHADTSHTNVAYNHTAFSNNYYHTPYSHTAFSNVYYHTPHTNTAHKNVAYSHTPHSNTSHTNGCSDGWFYSPAEGTHYNYSCPQGYGHCNWSNASPSPYHADLIKHLHHAFSNSAHVNIPYSHTPYSHTPHKDSYSHTPHKNVAFSNSYSHTPHKNVAYSHTPFVNFCNHTDHNAG